MTTNKWVMLIVLCVITGASFAISAAICSKQSAVNTQPAMGRTPLLMTSYLQLSSEQEKRVAPINDAFRMDQHAVCMDMQNARTRLLTLLKQSEPNQRDLDTVLADIEKTQAKLQRRAAQYILELKPILTKDQQKKLFDLVENRFCEQGKCGGGICPGMGSRGCNGMSGRM